MTNVNKTVNTIFGTILSLLPLQAEADYLLARRVPTGRQVLGIVRLDQDKEKEIDVLTNNLLLKYFTESGAGAIVSIPFVYKSSLTQETAGLGDLGLTITQIIGITSGWTIAPYLKVKFPTGDFDPKKLSPGTGRFDISIGLSQTYTTSSLEIDALTEYTFQTTNPKTGLDPGDVFQGSLSIAYTHPGLWAGVEGLVKQTGEDQKYNQPIKEASQTFALGPETRFSLGRGFLLQFGGKLDHKDNTSLEGRIFYNF